MTRVSTITPCYNMGRYIEGFLDNLSKQTHKDLEIVLDHNDPTDAEVKLVEQYNEKIGITKNRRSREALQNNAKANL